MADLRQEESDTTRSGLEVQRTYTADDLAATGFDEPADLGRPGAPPYTRGIEEGLYAEAPWIMGMYSGYSSPAETNQRFRRLIEAGQTGFSIALDLPTQMGIDSDDPRAVGEVGRVGTPVNSLADLELLLDGIPLDRVKEMRTSANSIGPIFAAMFVAIARKRGVDPTSFRVMLQNDGLKEYLARGTYIFPPGYGLKFSADVIEYCATDAPNWKPIEFCGYHIRDAGTTAVEEVAIAIANGIAYLDEVVRRGVDISTLKKLMFFFSSDVEIFEEAAKFRVARRLWSRIVQERYGDAAGDAGKIGIFCYTLGGSLTAQEPYNNVVRVAYQALAAALGGVQTLASSSFDEALGLPSEFAARLSLRTQHVLAYETGVTRTDDPLAGSYFLESLCGQLEERVREQFDAIQELGGSVAALERGYLHALVADAAYAQQQDIESGRRKVVGVNWLRNDAELGSTAFAAEALETREGDVVAALEKLKVERDRQALVAALDGVRAAAAAGQNTIPAIIPAVEAYATVGEICSALAEVWGRHSAASNIF